VTSLKTNKHLIELDLCENLIGTAEVRCSTFLNLEVFLFSQFRRSRQERRCPLLCRVKHVLS
jgi:hypothetical protein